MDSAYRTSLLDWCNDIEKTWTSVRNQLDHVDDAVLTEWEEDFYAFKQEVEEDNRFLQDKELQRNASQIYQSLNSFITGSSQPTKHDDHMGSAVPIGGHTLPPLPYAYDALEPVISEEIMRLHHDVHHQGYVDGLNKAEKKMQEARKTGNFDLIKHWERETAFNGSGHYLHTIFWDIMSPNGGGKPSGSLHAEIKRSFGSFDAFKKHFSEAAKKVEAVGWAILVWAPRAHRLEILTAEKHQNLTQWDTIPLLVLDVWEHAYYLQYKTKRGDYVDNWWKVVNWPAVEKRFEEARKLKWQPF
ncbi:superoxide dismutase [Radiobacillus kanasensis]|uniref:superoxide dismutase n=1 Tax=Radiobacillus kanasensis TaxID=2844358 RepID=UPI001E30F2D8|nr:superoxide dismutase [Radiobacillus kanasensis]UFU01470.1 superoxide dismutase [Radiobacillus kanasensis]